VDVVTTMLDETIPLTTFEWDEWGDPRDPGLLRVHAVVLAVRQRRRRGVPEPAGDGGLHDSQVQYWEADEVGRPAACHHHTGDNRILLKTNMEAGHGGAAGRYQRWREIAFEYAFLLDLADREPVGPSARVQPVTP
jgi:oligopeptidase B